MWPQNVEELSQDLIFHNNFWQNVKSFSKQNSKLRIHSKPERNQSKLTVCNARSSVDIVSWNFQLILQFDANLLKTDKEQVCVVCLSASLSHLMIFIIIFCLVSQSNTLYSKRKIHNSGHNGAKYNLKSHRIFQF